MKILPITDEDRQQQIDEIDNEMTVKLTELRDIMATGGLNKSTKFIKDNFLGSQKCQPVDYRLKLKERPISWKNYFEMFIFTIFTNFMYFPCISDRNLFIF